MGPCYFNITIFLRLYYFISIAITHPFSVFQSADGGGGPRSI